MITSYLVRTFTTMVADAQPVRSAQVVPVNLPMGAHGPTCRRAPGAMAVCAQPEYLFVASPESGDVTVIEIGTRRVLAVLTVGQEPGFIAITPDSQYALVLNHRSGDLAVIRIAAISQRRNEAERRSRTAPLFTLIPVGAKPVSAAVVTL